MKVMGTLCLNSFGSVHKSYQWSLRIFFHQSSSVHQKSIKGYHSECYKCTRVPPLLQIDKTTHHRNINLTHINNLYYRIPQRCISCSRVFDYKEDFTLLGIPQNSTADEIKRAYFKKAKEVHPDSSDQKDDTKFIELTNAYERLINESKYGTSSYDSTDPRNDPRCKEYWDLRKRPPKTEEQIQKERESKRRRKAQEKKMFRRMAVGIILAVFFGTIFPALFVGQGEQVDMCVCNKCMLKRVRSNPSTVYVLRDIEMRRSSMDLDSSEQDLFSKKI